MSGEVVVSALGRLGSSVRFSRIEVWGRTATETSLRLTARPSGPPDVRASTTRSLATRDVIEAVLRLVPPRPDFLDRDSRSIRVPWEALVVFATAPEGIAASYVRSMLGWADVPECLTSVQPSVRAELLVTTAGSRQTAARWWVSGDAGWVGLGPDGGRVLMVPGSLEDIRRALLFDLVGAIVEARA